MTKKISLLVLLSLLYGCESLKSLVGSKAKEPQEEVPLQPQKKDAFELKFAQMWARMDELESTILQQKEKIKLLEQGLMLGITPSTLPTPSSSEPAKEHKVEQAHQESSSGNKSFEERHKKAQGLFEQNQYGKAYLAYSKIDEDFPQDVTLGVPSYWIGRCLFALKEYTQAKEMFTHVVKNFSAQDISKQAKLYLARTELGLGLTSQASLLLTELIQEAPSSAVAKSAQQLLDGMRKEL